MKKSGFVAVKPGPILPELVSLRPPRDLASLLASGGSTKSAVSMSFMVTALLDSHSLLARACVKGASVLAHDFTLAMVEVFLKAMGERYDGAALIVAAGELVQDEMWEVTTSLRYRFHHAAIRHIVYSTVLPQDQRMLLHSVAYSRMELLMREQAASQLGASDDLDRAFCFSAVDLAYHAEGAGFMFKAATAYLKCADEVAVDGSPSVALEYAVKGLGALDKLEKEEAAGRGDRSALPVRMRS